MSNNQGFQLFEGGLINSSTTFYEVQKLLGQGTYGAVAQCQKLSTKETVALKILKNKEYINEAKQEEVILKKLRQHGAEKFNIVSWTDSFTCYGHYILEFEKLDISLHEFLQRSYFRRLQLAEIRPILKQLATALKFLKNTGIVHADLKPENVMMVDHVGQPLKVKVIDFGLALENPIAWRGVTVQTLWYRSPEVLLGHPFDEAIDVWSLGCIAGEMLWGAPLFPANDEYDMMRHIVYTVGKPPDHMMDSGLYSEQFFTEVRRGRDLPTWRFMSQLEVRNYSCSMRTIGSLSDLRMKRHNFSGENTSKANDLDLDSFVDLVIKMLMLNPTERISPRQILQHPFLTKSHLADTVNTKSSKEAMNHSEGRSFDDCRERTHATLKRCRGLDTPACTSSSTYTSVPGKVEPEMSGRMQCPLQSDIISTQKSLPNKRRRDSADDMDCDSRSQDTVPAKRRKNEHTETALTEAEAPNKRKMADRDDADPYISSDGSSPSKKRKSVSLSQELIESVKKLLEIFNKMEDQDEDQPSMTPVTQVEPPKTPQQKRKMADRDDANTSTSTDGSSPLKKRRIVNLKQELRDSVKICEIFTRTEEHQSSMTQVTHVKPPKSRINKRKMADRNYCDPCSSDSSSPAKRRRIEIHPKQHQSSLTDGQEKSCPVKKRRRSVDGEEGF